MCGIIGGFDTRPKASVNDWVIRQFEDQHDRGMKGFGLIGFSPQSPVVIERACEPAKFMFDLHAKSFPMLLAHHRTPTSSDNLTDQTHPLEVSHDSLEFDYLVVHNGIIRNDDELKTKHEGLGFIYQTAYTEVFTNSSTLKFNDSEVFAIEIARYIENHVTVCETLGSVAFIALQLNKKTHKVVQIFFGRNTNPLNLAKSRHEMYLSSEGKGAPIEGHILYSCKPQGEMKLSQRPLHMAVEKVVTTSPIGFKTLSPTKPARSTLAHSASTQYLKDENEWLTWEEKQALAATEKNDGWPAGLGEDEGVAFKHSLLDEVIDEANKSLEAYLDLLDDPDCVYFARPEECLIELQAILEDAYSRMFDQYDSHSDLPDPGGDPQVATPGSGLVPAGAQDLEGKSL
jgi:hypothetical protein